MRMYHLTVTHLKRAFLSYALTCSYICKSICNVVMYACIVIAFAAFKLKPAVSSLVCSLVLHYMFSCLYNIAWLLLCCFSCANSHQRFVMLLWTLLFSFFVFFCRSFSFACNYAHKCLKM